MRKETAPDELLQKRWRKKKQQAILFIAAGTIFFERELHLAAIGTLFILIGHLCNMTVMYANGGKMPVSPKIDKETIKKSYRHVPMTEKTKMKYLADIFVIKIPFVMSQVLSAGDIIIDIGRILLTIATANIIISYFT